MAHLLHIPAWYYNNLSFLFGFDENGNKKDYSIYTVNQSNTGLSLSYAEFFSDKGNIKLKDLSVLLSIFKKCKLYRKYQISSFLYFK